MYDLKELIDIFKNYPVDDEFIYGLKKKYRYDEAITMFVYYMSILVKMNSHTKYNYRKIVIEVIKKLEIKDVTRIHYLISKHNNRAILYNFMYLVIKEANKK